MTDIDTKQRDVFKIGSLIIIGLIVAAFVIFPALDKAQAGEPAYEPLTPQAQVSYDAAKIALCESEKTLAQAKFMDSANGVDVKADLNSLRAKRDMNCADF